jgi:hypothetical protein
MHVIYVQTSRKIDVMEAKKWRTKNELLKLKKCFLPHLGQVWQWVQYLRLYVFDIKQENI